MAGGERRRGGHRGGDESEQRERRGGAELGRVRRLAGSWPGGLGPRGVAMPPDTPAVPSGCGLLGPVVRRGTVPPVRFSEEVRHAQAVPVLPGIQPSTSAYSQVVEANGFVFVAGQVGNDKGTGEVVPGGIEAETRAMFANMERCLAAVGLGLGDVVKSTVYLVDMDDWAAYNDVFRELFPADPPTRATVAVAASSRRSGSRPR